MNRRWISCRWQVVHWPDGWRQASPRSNVTAESSPSTRRWPDGWNTPLNFSQAAPSGRCCWSNARRGAPCSPDFKLLRKPSPRSLCIVLRPQTCPANGCASKRSAIPPVPRCGFNPCFRRARRWRPRNGRGSSATNPRDANCLCASPAPRCSCRASPITGRASSSASGRISVFASPARD